MATQYGEDELILKHFEGRTGRFLDVGAGDGKTFSNTAPLLDLGWSGVMVEPAVSQLRYLLENHADNPNVDIVCCGISQQVVCGATAFWDGRDFSTSVRGHRDLITQHSEGKLVYRKRVAPMLTWRELLAWHPGPYQFVNIDVEGMNTELLLSIPWGLLQPEMICIEIDPAHQLPIMQRELGKVGLGNQQMIGGNLLAWRTL